MHKLVYFSNVTENTKRFVEKLEVPAWRIPLRAKDETLDLDGQEYVLALPTYGFGGGAGAIPRQVIRFLNYEPNRRGIRGVIAAGNTNFGAGYCLAGTIISEKCQVPVLHRFELLGTPDDVKIVLERLEQLWEQT